MVKSPSPVLALCRKLIEVGYASSMPLQVYRGDILCLSIRSIGEAALLEVHGSHFMRPKHRTGGPAHAFGDAKQRPQPRGLVSAESAGS